MCIIQHPKKRTVLLLSQLVSSSLVVLPSSLPLPEKTSLTLSDTCKEFQNPSLIKTCSVNFYHVLNCRSRNEVKRSSHSRYILSKRIKQSN